MEKMKMESTDGVQSNIEKIGKLFPNCITEALDLEKSTPDHPVYKKAINFETLKQLLSNDVVDGDEAYEMTWVGKKAAIVESNKPIRKTLRPCPEESVDWDTTENLYIEGDNLEVLKLLQESYLGRIKMIYIDPPYNTGQDFIYPDSYVMDNDEFGTGSGYYNDEGNINYSRKNVTTQGRFHSDWCSMIYPRLKLASTLLAEDGVIFISIDDNEQANLRKICDEIFGENNFVNTVIWEKRYSPQNAVQWFSENHDFILVYAKNKTMWHPQLLERTPEMNARYKNIDNDPRGPWKPVDSTAQGGHGTKSQFYTLTAPNGKKHILPPGRCWLYTEPKMREMIADNRIWFGEDGNNVPAIKRFLTDVKQGVASQTIWKYDEVGHSQDGKKELKKLFPEGIPFDTPKPTELIRKMIKLSGDDDFIVMDFFAGSGTTADAVMKMNSTDQGKRKYILVQLPEPIKDRSDLNVNNYRTISSITKERIKRAGKNILENQPILAHQLDLGFRCFKLDDSNMKDVYFHPDDLTQNGLVDLETNIVEGRTELDLFFGCIIDWGLPLSLPYKIENIAGFNIHNYNDGDLIGCFEERVSEELVREIASRKPMRAVFRDSSFGNSPEKINVFEIFKKYMPEDSDDITKRVKVI